MKNYIKSLKNKYLIRLAEKLHKKGMHLNPGWQKQIPHLEITNKYGHTKFYAVPTCTEMFLWYFKNYAQIRVKK